MNTQNYKASVSEHVNRFTQKMEQRKPRWWSPRGFLLFFLPLPLIPALFISLGKGDLSKSLIHVVAVAMYLAAALLARKGLRRDHDELAKISNRHFLPLKLAAGLMIALATGLCSWQAVEHTLVFSLLMAFLAYTGFYLSYGVEPYKLISLRGNSGDASEQALNNMLSEAQLKIHLIENYASELRNMELKQRLQRISHLAQDIIARIEQQPSNRHSARKFLYVYLDGALRVTEGYVRTHQQTNLLELEDKFRNVLITIEDVFEQQKQHFLKNDILDLDVQIEVLTKQMQQEGIH